MRALLLLLLLAGPAMAQPPPEIAARIAAIGRVVAPPPTAAIYAPLHARGPWPGIAVTRDAAYGPDPRNRLDVYAPEGRAAPRPVLVFVHGGGFVAGDKQGPDDSPFYRNVAIWAARNGMVGVNMTYRLAPANPYPAAQRDIAQALAWVAANAASHGGDAGRVVLAGHSAGAIHAAIYATQPGFHPPGIASPVAFALISALYDFTGAEVPPNDRAYMGDDPAERAARSPLPRLGQVRQPVFLAHGSLDPERFVRHSQRAQAVLCAAGRCPAAVTLEGHSHMSEIYAIGTADESLTGPLLAFIRRWTISG